MTYIESIVSLVILSLFLAVFSQVAYPSLISLKKAHDMYESARNLQFIDQSFRKECARTDLNFERWKHDALYDKNISSCDIQQVYRKGTITVYKACFEISGEKIEIFAENVK
jgi:competence protein ComGF